MIALALLVLFMAAVSPPAQSQEEHRAHHEPMSGAMAPSPMQEPVRMKRVLGLSQAREGSGTSWLPEETQMYAFHRRWGSWNVMLHGNLFLQFIDEGGARGDEQLGSINWIMAMADRRLGPGQLGFRTMFSAEPWTIRKCGYPDLLATGESCDGSSIHDHQHPHDLFMELAGFYRVELSSVLGLEIYGGPAAEPALGPTAFPHRLSSFPDPMAPITHHWLDSTHISFGVATVGLFTREWKIEGSVFNGREPDEVRTNLDLAPMNSYSGRIQFLPSSRWAFQVSAGHLAEAELAMGDGSAGGSRKTDVDRTTASAIYHEKLPNKGIWATTLAYGRNFEAGSATNAVLLETSYNSAETHLVSGRLEWVEKDGHDLDLRGADFEHRLFPLVKAEIGYTYQFKPISGLTPGIGAGALVSFLPDELAPFYGERNPVGFVAFASLRPAPMEQRAHAE